MFVIWGVEGTPGTGVAVAALDSGAAPRFVTGATVQEYSLPLIRLFIVIGELELLAVTCSVSLIPHELRTPSRTMGPASTSSTVSTHEPSMFSCAIEDKLSTGLSVAGNVPTRFSPPLLPLFHKVSTVPAGEVKVMTRSEGSL